MKLQENIRTLFADTMGYDAEDIELKVPLLEIGADSFTMMSVTRKIKETYGVAISMRDIFENINTIEKITSYVRENSEELPLEEIEEPVYAESKFQAEKTLPKIENNTVTKEFSQNYSFKKKPKEIKSFSRVSDVQSDKAHNGNFKTFTPRKMTFSQSGSTAVNGKNDDASTAWVDTKKAKELTPEQEIYLNEFIEEYSAKTLGSKRIAQESRPYLCNNRKSSSGFRVETKELLYPIVTNTSKGSKIWDVDNNEYVDIAMGFGSTLFGHNPDFLKKSLQEQIEKGYQIGPESELTAENARLIAETVNMDRVLFSNTGTEAVMTAIRIARAASGKKKIVVFQNSYHGHCDNVLVVPDIESDRFESKRMVPGIPESAIEDTLILPYGNVKALSFIEENAHDIAAVIVEPVRNYIGNKNPGEFLKNIREITKRKDIILVFDEVLVGFRLALGGAQEWFDIEADITTYGKAIAAGIPVGIVAGKSWCMDWVDGGYWSYGDDSAPIGNQTYTAGTFCKHPLAMTAVNAAIKEMLTKGPALQNELNERTEEMCIILDDIIAYHKVPLKVHRFGSNFRFSMSGNLSFAFQPLELDIFFYHVIKEGVYVWEGRTCFISTAHTDDDLNKIIDAVHNAIKKMKEAGFWAEKKRLNLN
ncbi:aminotransferase class III-fold pyridoxal phosphate-dependent enzyme [Tenacibaculum tangerinum]|uniref:Aminotransferase class III-fold pyridoxal phosphate-dependent enzyme n=1 Tax=Tenacibaculum tangerinum TaxID=3038772 RepID=A0ABY8L1J5_9FLAO|nr:aminotransferase class III-fold pyridoxal phosphate-dependent enzyme [Tenacibaculum tangerinum]WGH74223.1 aminotransferase class III-fold pyridoxal phosphate-dependent enzyme [Tenacibaculum tangerinum]